MVFFRVETKALNVKRGFTGASFSRIGLLANGGAYLCRTVDQKNTINSEFLAENFG